MVVEYKNVQILQGLAAEMWRNDHFERAFETLFNASCVLQELDAADQLDVSVCDEAADILDDLACMQELRGDFEEAYNYQWLRLKVLTGLENPVLQHWAEDIVKAMNNPAIAHAYSALCTILLAKADKLRTEGKVAEAMKFFADALLFMERCGMLQDNSELMKSTRRDVASVLTSMGRAKEAEVFAPGKFVIVECRNVQPYAHVSAEKIFHRPTHGGPPVMMPLDDDASAGPVFKEKRELTANDIQRGQQREHALNCLRSVGLATKAFTAQKLERKIDTALSFSAKQIQAEKVFIELMNEEDQKMGAKEARISKRKARRLQKEKQQQAAAEAEASVPVEAVEPVLDPEQQYRRALESLDASLQCPLTLTTMKDPVITQYGHSFERAEIELWFKTKHTCPMTGVAVTSKVLTPNIALKTLIEAAEALKEAAEARELAAAK
jgi:hypothetical protein